MKGAKDVKGVEEGKNWRKGVKEAQEKWKLQKEGSDRRNESSVLHLFPSLPSFLFSHPSFVSFLHFLRAPCFLSSLPPHHLLPSFIVFALSFPSFISFLPSLPLLPERQESGKTNRETK
jgi:hypothetical protein